MTVAKIVWARSWDDVPFNDPAACSHPGSDTLAIGYRLEPDGRGRRPAMDALFCMLCGVDASGKMPPGEARTATLQEHGRHIEVHKRVFALAERATAA